MDLLANEAAISQEPIFDVIIEPVHLHECGEDSR
jgi:hypothetical protein